MVRDELGLVGGRQVGAVAHHLVIAALDDADLLRVEPARIALVIYRLVTREKLRIEEQLGVEGGELGAPFGVDILDAVARLVRRLDAPHREDAVHRVARKHHRDIRRSEEHTSALQYLMRISYTVFFS